MWNRWNNGTVAFFVSKYVFSVPTTIIAMEHLAGTTKE